MSTKELYEQQLWITVVLWATTVLNSVTDQLEFFGAITAMQRLTAHTKVLLPSGEQL